MRRVAWFVAVMVLTAGCVGRPDVARLPVTTTTSTTTTTTLPPSTTTTIEESPAVRTAPWAAPSLTDVPDVLAAQWEAAANREWCSALFPSNPGDLGDGVIRSADFTDGWAVAWDLPSGSGRSAGGEYCTDCGRGAYGIAGTGLRAVGNETDVFADRFLYDDGSKLAIGFEDGATTAVGAPLPAELLVTGEGCLYQVWSFLGTDHLEALLAQLRFVDGMRGEPTAWLSQISSPAARDLGDPPWGQAPLARDAVPDAAYLEWAGEKGAPTTCPMLYFADLGDADGATIRRAANEGEMLVAWDLPSGPGHSGASEPCDDCGRGVIGLGTFPADTRQDSPAVYTWSDGSDATTLTGPYRYGTEAFVHVTGFDCTYWVWSHLGADHLEYLLGQLRRVEGAP
ncbi:hypothetical protein BMS3Abin02_00411 [bacterium BMS3Abin02]|nr:hypothetical protein BMS3Abin02_00411 [bacterium BMS3Abin02]